MSSYHQSESRGFQLFSSVGSPSWRRPQRAALGAVIAQWSLVENETPLVSLPTGVGKTAVALAAPFLAGAHRTLIVVPTKELRRQTVRSFRSQEVLRRIGALREKGFKEPVVAEVAGRTSDWEVFKGADVVVGIPASISPVYYKDNPPPEDLFDLVIIDEAHHAPAATWMAILAHFSGQSLLLTATPHRRDRKRLPGKNVYYYPLRQALEERLYQPVDPLIVDIPEGTTRAEIDALIANETVNVLAEPQHETSQFMVRAGTKARADALATLYAAIGHEIPVLHSGLGAARQRSVINGLRNGDHRGLVMVGMLVEGFDLPSLRVAAYHDKHKSLEPTAQLIGRLARVDDAYPQRSVLVTARDIDVYPHLEGVLRELYLEDRDWAQVLPGIIDGFVEDDLLDTEYARLFHPAPGAVDLARIHPLRRGKIFEIISGVPWSPIYSVGEIPDVLAVGASFAGHQILYSGTNPDHTTLLLVTGQRTRPRWNHGDNLDSFEYDLHLVSYRAAAQVDQPDLLIVNSKRVVAQNLLLKVIGADEVTRAADAPRIQQAFDSLQRLSVSSVGVRNTYGATRGSPSYKMFAGSAIESGLRDSDTAQAALGHAMAQVAGDEGPFTAGVSTGKSKYWETRYTPLRAYEDFVADLAARYWYPTVAASGPLLPQINRGRNLTNWPNSPVLAAMMDYALFGAEWNLNGQTPIEWVDLRAGASATDSGAPIPSSTDHIALAAVLPTSEGDQLLWTGETDLRGRVMTTAVELGAARGHSNPVAFSELLTERPPSILFLDGSTVRGGELFPPAQSVTSLPAGLVSAQLWDGVDITAETKTRAGSKKVGISVHEWLEGYLRSQPRRGRHRWILSNDGAGEIADYIVIEMLPTRQVAVGLWHAKYSGGSSSSVRITDFEVVTSQAVKSRRWPTDRRLWEELGRRLAGASPPALLVEGNLRTLEVLLGTAGRFNRLSLAQRRPSIVGQIGIVQPGLSLAKLGKDLTAGTTNAIQIVQLLSTFRDAVLSVAEPIVLSAP